MRWAEAQAAKRRGEKQEGSCPAQLFLGQWEAPGLIALDARGQVRLLFYMRPETRARWKRNITHGCSREQEHAPPETLPADTISIFTDGSAIYDKTVKAWVAAGYGLTAVTRGTGHEHVGGVPRHEEFGPIAIGDEGAEQKTNNVAELVAFIHALRWARTSPQAAGRPIVLRYDSKYCALITCGVYKAKKNNSTHIHLTSAHPHNHTHTHNPRAGAHTRPVAYATDWCR